MYRINVNKILEKTLKTRKKIIIYKHKYIYLAYKLSNHDIYI